MNLLTARDNNPLRNPVETTGGPDPTTRFLTMSAVITRYIGRAAAVVGGVAGSSVLSIDSGEIVALIGRPIPRVYPRFVRASVVG
jgi:hypothetical protein